MTLSTSYVAPSAINTLNDELNPICHLLALLEAHPILHISRIRVKGQANTKSCTETCSGILYCKSAANGAAGITSYY